MAHLQFDAHEQADLRTTARDEFRHNPALALADRRRGRKSP
ncbi:hypothetical protein [Streptomyces decoyicus]